MVNDTLLPYRFEQRSSKPYGTRILDTYEPIKGRRTEHPLVIYLGGATGAGKTVLANLYSKEEGISYDVIDLASQAGINLNVGQLRDTLNFRMDEKVYVGTVPKLTTRNPRPTELHGIDFYFVSPQDFEKLQGTQLFTYRYPKNGNGALYGMPEAITWPLRFGIDSITTMTGYEAFSKMFQSFPNGAGIWIDADPNEIDAHIKGRAASEPERVSRLHSFPEDRQDFLEHRQEIAYSVFVDALKSLRRDITPDRERLIIQEMDNPLRQIKAIVGWERYIRSQGLDIIEPQRKFDYFLESAVRLIFNGMEYGELKGKVERGDHVRVFDKYKDEALLETYIRDKNISKALLDDIVNRIRVNAVFDANGRRTIVLSPYLTSHITSIGGTEKKVVVELLRNKLNGVGAHLVTDSPNYYYRRFSHSGLLKSPFYGLDEALFVYLTSDHIKPLELERPRALSVIFSNAPNPQQAKSLIKPATLEEISQEKTTISHSEPIINMFLRAT